MGQRIGIVLVVAGATIALLGLLIWTGAFGWFGRLPGDIRIERGDTRIYIPLTSMLVVSGALSLLGSAVVYLLRRFF